MSEQQNQNTIDDTMKSGSNKSGADKVQGAKNAVNKSKNVLNKMKGVKSLAPLVSVISTIGIILLVLFLIIGFIGFFVTLPGLAIDKFLEACTNAWRWMWGDNSINFEGENIVELGQYIEDLGYDLEGYGFVTPGAVIYEKDENDKEKVKEIRTDKTWGWKSNLYSYILSNERTYAVQGADQGFLVNLFGSVPLIGDAITAVDTKIRENWPGFDPQYYGLISFDPNDENSPSKKGYKVSIDRQSNEMMITTNSGFLGLDRDQMKWDLTGWTSRYGKPIELSLALHLSTMAPDFVENFCSNNDLQTRVNIGTDKVNYHYEYYYKSEAGGEVTADQIIEAMRNINQGKLEDIQQIFNVDNKKLNTIDNYQRNWDDGTGGDLTPSYDVLDQTSIIEVATGSTNGDKYYCKLLDKDGKPINLAYTRNGSMKYYEVKYDDNNMPYLEEFDSNDSRYSQAISHVPDNYITDYELLSQSNSPIQMGDNETKIRLAVLSLKDLGAIINNVGFYADRLVPNASSYTDNAEKLNKAREIIGNSLINQGDITVEYIKGTYYNRIFTVMDEFISNEQNVNEKFNGVFADPYAERAKKIDLNLEVFNYEYQGNGLVKKGNKITYDNSEETLHNASSMWDEITKYINEKLSNNETLETFQVLAGQESLPYYVLEEMKQFKMQEPQTNENGYPVYSDENYIKMLVVYSDGIEAKLAEWTIDYDTFFRLYNVFKDLKTDIETYRPYIRSVTKHWYKDLDFTNPSDVYNFRNIGEKEKKFNPEGTANTEDITKLNEEGRGQIWYKESSQDKIRIQDKQPKIIKTESWHYMVKNWLLYGYYFIYDGTEKTATFIKGATDYLENFGYDPADPLLGVVKDNNIAQDTLYSEKDKKETVYAKQIDDKAAELNEILRDKGYSVRLQKINFEKKSSLQAFSILEAMHTEDSEYIYRDLKEFLIELGYFTRADFESVETDVFKWIIQGYTVYKDEWPDPKYEKSDTQYGTYIRSAESLKTQREKEVDDAKKSMGLTGVQNNYTTSGDGYNTITTVNGVTYKNYKQYKGSYAENIYWDGSGTMSTSGCGPTSAAVILSGYGIDKSPWDVANILKETCNGITSCTELVNAMTKLGCKTTYYNTANNIDEAIKNIDEALTNGKPVLVGTNTTDSGHYVALLGKDQNGNVIISDVGDVANLNNYTGTVADFVNKWMQNCAYAIPDEAPSGSTTKQEVEGFESGLNVIMPESGKITKIGNRNDDSKDGEKSTEESTNDDEETDYFATNGEYIRIEFKTNNGVNGWKMEIEGLTIDKATLTEGQELKKGDVIGKTNEKNMKVILYDEKDAIINNVEDYFNLKTRKTVGRVSQEYEFTEDEVIMLAKLIEIENGPNYITSLLDGDKETAMNIAKATGYVCINNAIRENKRIKTGDDGIIYYPKYASPEAIENCTPSAESIEAAEWCAKYDCSSITNPDGVPMSKNVTGQAGFGQCPGEDSTHSTCWWVVDWKGRGTYGKIEDYNEIGDNCDLFFCYSELPK